uniref:right-handed parallel beta-helix repeat-containing protein n=1 Tax=uncultured Methanobrevibacter sp. TaxID=253161 RepID=UPI0025E1445F
AEGCNVVIENIEFVDGGIKDHASIENYGSLTLKNCSFTGFETDTIIYNSGSLNITDGVFSLNSINNAIVLNNGKLFIEGAEFSSNVINTNSVVYNNGNAEIVDSNFTENINNGNGGAIYNKNSLTIKDTVFNENEGINGGAVYNEGTLEVLNSTFEDNTANGYGGAIFNDGEANIANSSFSGSFSAKDGGAIYNNNMLIVNNSTLVANTATGNGGAIYNNKTLKLAESFFGINFAYEYANIYNAGDVQDFRDNTFDFYDVILYVPDGEYGIPTTITGTLDPQFNMDLQLTLPGFVNYKDANVTITDGIFEYNTGVLPKGAYDVILNEVIYDKNGNVYYGESIRDRLIVNKANVYINLTVEDIILKNSDIGTPVLKINASKNGTFQLLFNNRLSTFTIANSQAEITLDSVGEGNYSVMVVREGDENYNDAANGTTFTVSEYLGNFIVNSTGGKFDTLAEAINNSAAEDIIYVMEGTYSGFGYAAGNIVGKKLTIIALGDVVFDQSTTNLGFINTTGDSDITICNAVFTGFKTNYKNAVFFNRGNLTLDGCAFANNTLGEDSDTIEFKAFIYNEGNLNIVNSEFYDNNIYHTYLVTSKSDIIINESTFENNTIDSWGRLINITNANSAKIISTEFVENTLGSGEAIFVEKCNDVLINAEFYDNTKGEGIFARDNSKLNIENSIFTGNAFSRIIESWNNVQNSISGCTFTNNTGYYIVLSEDKNLSVSESTFLSNTLSDNPHSGESTLFIGSDVNASVNGCVFAENKGGDCRNIYSENPNVNITHTTFDTENVDYAVSDIDYGKTETINGTIDIGTNFDFNVNLNINNKVYPVKVTNNKFTLTLSNLTGGDYDVVLNAQNDDSNTFVFNQKTKTFTVNRIDPGLKVTISNITQGEKLEVNATLINNATDKILYQLDGKWYNKTQLENLTLTHGNYLVAASYGGNKNYYPVGIPVYVEVYKTTPNITVSDAEANYGEDIEINVKVDDADYYTVFINDSYDDAVSLYIGGSGTFTVPSKNFKPGKYEIKVYKIETDDYNEAYGYANLTVNENIGIFNLSNDTIYYGENATVHVKVPENAYGNITYTVYDSNMNPVYTITQSCLEELVVPNLYVVDNVGKYLVTGTYEGDSYYTNKSVVYPGVVLVIPKTVELNITVSNITYGEKAVVTVGADADGEYLVYVGNETYKVNVVNGTGNVSVPGLTVGSYTVNATAIDGNYSAFEEAVFEVTSKQISVVVSVEDITYGDNATVVVQADVDGEYIVSIRGENYTVSVNDGEGVKYIPDLTVGKDIFVSVTVVDGNYSAYNTTTFNVNKQDTPIELDVATGENNVTMTVTVDEAATGLVKFQVTGPEEYTLYVDVIDGKAVLQDILETGDYTVIATYMGDSRFNTNITSEEFTLKGHIKKDTPITASAEVVGYRVTVTVNVDENATGFVRLAVGGTVANIEVVDGVAKLTTNLLPNSYFVEVTYLGDDNFNMNSTSVTFTVTEVAKENTTIDLDVLVYEDTALIMVDLD